MQLPADGDLFEGRYRIDAMLGEGGFARVYAATTLDVGRAVAIKILKPEQGGYDPQIVARFLQEARVMSGLRDAHTITMYDCGRTEEGLLYIVCELLPGNDLSELISRRRPFEEAEMLKVVRQILLSLREAHAAGLLHRDIKPANVRVFEYLGDPLTVKVLDFGIARFADGEKGLTRTGSRGSQRSGIEDSAAVMTRARSPICSSRLRRTRCCRSKEERYARGNATWIL